MQAALRNPKIVGSLVQVGFGMDAWKPASPASLHVLSPGRTAAGRLEVQRKLEQPTHNAFRMLTHRLLSSSFLGITS